MLDLIFCALMIIIVVRANTRGEVNDTMCNVALVVGILAGVVGLVQAFFTEGENFIWVLNIIVMLMAFVLKRVAKHFAKLHDQKIEEIQEEYRKGVERRQRHLGESQYVNTDFDDPNVRFGGGDGEVWKGK